MLIHDRSERRRAKRNLAGGDVQAVVHDICAECFNLNDTFSLNGIDGVARDSDRH